MGENEVTPFGTVKNADLCKLCKYKGECKTIVHRYCVDNLEANQYFE